VLSQLELASEHQPVGNDDQDEDHDAHLDPPTPAEGGAGAPTALVGAGRLAPRTVTDAGLACVLDTFTHLTHLSVSCADVTLAAPGIVNKLGALTRLQVRPSLSSPYLAPI
jgi:hypothetical protein